jgi:8-hydroxy-5-deazaflavin:NADPH oxidoreductase
MATYGVLGTGTVGRTISEKLIELGHDVRMGTRQPDATRARTEPDERGRESAASWLTRNPDVELSTFERAVSDAEVVVNATSGSASIDVLRSAGAANLGSDDRPDVQRQGPALRSARVHAEPPCDATAFAPER